MDKSEILKTEYSEQFDEIRKNSVVQSFYKYGPIKKNFGEHMVNAMDTCILCLNKYEETHNTEYLTDAANYMMFEFMYPSYKDAHFSRTGSTDSAGVVGLTYNEMKSFQEMNQALEESQNEG